MQLIMRDTWIRHSKLDIGRGDDRLMFERCTFKGGTVRIDTGSMPKLLSTACFKARALRGNPFPPGSPAIAIGFDAARQTQWKAWAKDLVIPDAPQEVRREGYPSAMVLKVHQGRTYPGAVIASLSRAVGEYHR